MGLEKQTLQLKKSLIPGHVIRKEISKFWIFSFRKIFQELGIVKSWSAQNVRQARQMLIFKDRQNFGHRVSAALTFDIAVVVEV